MLEKVKLDLRFTHSKLDSDIQDNINACLADLRRVGVATIDELDPHIIKCVKLYCRWQYNFEDQADRYRDAYKALRNGLSLHTGYNDVAGAIGV